MENFQSRAAEWAKTCFGDEIPFDKLERADRFIEEALELAQTVPDFNALRAHDLVDYVFGRPVGDPLQEAGGSMVTLALLCNAMGISAEFAGEDQIATLWTKVEKIRAKQAAKPKGSAIPIPQDTK